MACVMSIFILKLALFADAFIRTLIKSESYILKQ